MSKKNKYGNIDPGDLLRYVQGEMSDEDRHALEREMQKDLFASEALEGLTDQRIEEVREDLDKLENQLNKRVSGRSSVVWIRIAASVAILLTVGTLYFTVFSDMINQTGRMAVETESKEQTREEDGMEKPPVSLKVDNEGKPEGEKPVEDNEKDRGEISKKGVVKEEKMEADIIVLEEDALAAGAGGAKDTVIFAGMEAMADQVEIVVETEEEQEIMVEEFALKSQSAPSRARSSDIAPPTVMAETPEKEISEAKASSSTGRKLASVDKVSEILSAVILSDSISTNPVGGMDSFREYISKNMQIPEGEIMDISTVVILRFNVGQMGRPGIPARGVD